MWHCTEDTSALGLPASDRSLAVTLPGGSKALGHTDAAGLDSVAISGLRNEAEGV